jgi:membrane protein implicated in regulation of membrane protease activity
MANYLVWSGIGLTLIIAELVTGTFYLLVLGIAALVGALAAYAGLPFALQAAAAAIVSVSGVLWIRARRIRSAKTAMPSPDMGQPVTWENWVDAANRVARVRYRGALWDARVATDAAGEPGEMLYIRAIDGNTLEVAKTRPA